MLKEFREFAMRGNVVDMAVGIIIGGAFGTIVKSLVDDVLMPPIGLLLGGTIGNLVDRIRVGQVTDFIDFKIWPVWNVADASVTVGTILLAFCLIFLAEWTPNKE